MLVNYNQNLKKFSLYYFAVSVNLKIVPIIKKIDKFLSNYENLKNKK